MRSRPCRPAFVDAVRFLASIVAAVALSSFAVAEQPSDVPAWLRSHIGDGEGQIADTVLRRARDLYRRKVREGVVRNPCYFAMDATRPNDVGGGQSGRRFYIVCESKQSFRAVPAGHGAGRDLDGLADFTNGRQCAKNFGNALDSELTAGGAYVTAETKSSFKGYYRVSAKQDAVLTRSFLQFDGEGETANARQRAIGGHAAVTLKGVCRRKESNSPHADKEGYVPFGTRIEYAGGRSNGCTSWSPSDAAPILALVKDDPTTLYIYPDAADVGAVGRAAAAGQSLSHAGLYWNAFCLRDIRSPKFWSKQMLDPILAEFRRLHPPPPPRPIPLCTAR